MIQIVCCLFLCGVINLFAVVLAVSNVKHYLLFDDMPLRYISKKDIKFFGLPFFQERAASRR